MPNRKELENIYKIARKALKADLNDIISNLEKLQIAAIDEGDMELADEYNDRLQEATSAKTLLIMTRVYDLSQTEAVQDAIASISNAEKEIDDTLKKEGLSDPKKLEKTKGILDSLNKLLSKIKAEIDR